MACECEIKISEVKTTEPWHFTELSGEVVALNGDLYFAHRIHGSVDLPESVRALDEGEAGKFQVRSPYGFRGLEVFVNKANGFVQRVIIHRNREESVALGAKFDAEKMTPVQPPPPAGCAPRCATEIVSRYQDCQDGTEFLKFVEMFYTVKNGDVVNEMSRTIRPHATRAMTREQARAQVAKAKALKAARAKQVVAAARPAAAAPSYHHTAPRAASRAAEGFWTKNRKIAAGVVVGVIAVIVIFMLIKRARDAEQRRRGTLETSPLGGPALARPGYTTSSSPVRRTATRRTHRRRDF